MSLKNCFAISPKKRPTKTSLGPFPLLNEDVRNASQFVAFAALYIGDDEEVESSVLNLLHMLAAVVVASSATPRHHLETIWNGVAYLLEVSAKFLTHNDSRVWSSKAIIAILHRLPNFSALVAKLPYKAYSQAWKTLELGIEKCVIAFRRCCRDIAIALTHHHRFATHILFVLGHASFSSKFGEVWGHPLYALQIVNLLRAIDDIDIRTEAFTSRFRTYHGLHSSSPDQSGGYRWTSSLEGTTANESNLIIDMRRGPPAGLALVQNHFRVPRQRNADFFDRADIFNLIGQNLNEHPTASTTETACLGLAGMAGIGKTEIALEFAYRCKEEYDVFWIDAGNLASITRALLGIKSQIETSLTIPSADINPDDASGLVSSSEQSKAAKEEAATDDEALNRAVQYLAATERRWLIIFDNVEDWHSLIKRPFWPASCANSSVVLFTSRISDASIPTTMRFVHVPPFDIDSGAYFLMKMTSAGPNDQLDQINAYRDLTVHSGGHPSVLVSIAAYGRRLSLVPTELRKSILDSPDQRVLLETIAPMGDLLLDKLSAESRKLVLLLCIFCSDHVPESILLRSIDHNSLLSEFSNISRLHLGVRDQQPSAGFSIPKMVRSLVLDTLYARSADIAGAFRFAIENATDHLEHLICLAEVYRRYEPSWEGDHGPIRTICEIISLILSIGYMINAQYLLDMVNGMLRCVKQPCAPVLAIQVDLLAAQCTNASGLSGRQQALDMRYKAITALESLPDGTDPDFSTTKTKLLHLAYGEVALNYVDSDTTHAFDLLCKSFDLLQHVGDEHTLFTLYAAHFDRLAHVHDARGDLQEAMLAMEKCLGLIQLHNDAGKSSIGYSLHFAKILVCHSRFEEAWVFGEKLLEKALVCLGIKNIFTAEIYLFLGVLAMYHQDFDQARRLIHQHEACAADLARGPEARARVFYYLSRTYALSDNVDEARRFECEAKETIQELIIASNSNKHFNVQDDNSQFERLIEPRLRIPVFNYKIWAFQPGQGFGPSLIPVTPLVKGPYKRNAFSLSAPPGVPKLTVAPSKDYFHDDRSHIEAPGSCSRMSSTVSPATSCGPTGMDTSSVGTSPTSLFPNESGITNGKPSITPNTVEPMADGVAKALSDVSPHVVEVPQSSIDLSARSLSLIPPPSNISRAVGALENTGQVAISSALTAKDAIPISAAATSTIISLGAACIALKSKSIAKKSYLVTQDNLAETKANNAATQENNERNWQITKAKFDLEERARMAEKKKSHKKDEDDSATDSDSSDGESKGSGGQSSQHQTGQSRTLSPPTSKTRSRKTNRASPTVTVGTSCKLPTAKEKELLQPISNELLRDLFKLKAPTTGPSTRFGSPSERTRKDECASTKEKDTCSSNTDKGAGKEKDILKNLYETGKDEGILERFVKGSSWGSETAFDDDFSDFSLAILFEQLDEAGFYLGKEAPAFIDHECNDESDQTAKKQSEHVVRRSTSMLTTATGVSGITESDLARQGVDVADHEVESIGVRTFNDNTQLEAVDAHEHVAENKIDEASDHGTCNSDKTDVAIEYEHTTWTDRMAFGDKGLEVIEMQDISESKKEWNREPDT